MTSWIIANEGGWGLVAPSAFDRSTLLIQLPGAPDGAMVIVYSQYSPKRCSLSTLSLLSEGADAEGQVMAAAGSAMQLTT